MHSFEIEQKKITKCIYFMLTTTTNTSCQFMNIRYLPYDWYFSSLLLTCKKKNPVQQLAELPVLGSNEFLINENYNNELFVAVGDSPPPMDQANINQNVQLNINQNVQMNINQNIQHHQIAEQPDNNEMVAEPCDEAAEPVLKADANWQAFERNN